MLIHTRAFKHTSQESSQLLISSHVFMGRTKFSLAICAKLWNIGRTKAKLIGLGSVGPLQERFVIILESSNLIHD